MTNPQLITTPFAENGTKNIIPEGGAAEPQLATMQGGFPETTQRPISEGGIPPERADFNGILNLYGQHLVHLNKGLLYEFDQDFANSIGGYPLNSRIMLTNGDVVQNTQEGNTNNPNSNMGGWKSSSVSKDVTVPTYKTTADGVNPVTGVADGAYFNVRSEDDDTVAVEYQNIGGSAVATGKRYLSALGVQLHEKPASTIKDASGRDQQEINDAQFSFNLNINTYLDNFPFYLPYSSNVLDYGPALKTALESGRPIILTRDAEYPIRSIVAIPELTKNIVIHGNNAKFKYSGSAVNELIKVEHSSPLHHSIYNLTIDGQMLVSTSLMIVAKHNNSLGLSTFNGNHLSLKNNKKSTTAHRGDSINIRGAFSNVVFSYSSVFNNCLGVDAGVTFVSGVTGICVQHYSATSYPEVLELRGTTVERIWSEDPDYTFDQDGVRFFSGDDAKTSKKNGGKMLVFGSKFKNCWGRSIKTQCRTLNIFGGTVYRDEGNSTKKGNVEIHAQTGNGYVSGVTFEYFNGHTGGVCFSIDSSGNYTKNRGVIRDCDVYLDSLTTLPCFASTYPMDTAQAQRLKIEDNDIYGKCEKILSALVNGGKNSFEVYDNFVDEIVAADHGDGILKKAFIVVKASGSVTPRQGFIKANGNVQYSGSDVNLVMDGISGVNINSLLTANGNLGFLEGTNLAGPGLKNKQTSRFDSVGSFKSTGWESIEDFALDSGAEYTYTLESPRGGMMFIGLSVLPLSQCILSGAGAVFGLLQSHNISEGATRVYYNNNKPASPVGEYLDIWRGSTNNTIVIRNNNASTRRVFIKSINA